MKTVVSVRHLSLPKTIQEAVAKGFHLFHAEQFWESHEAWESAWLRLPRSHQKIFIQALIQIAACLVLNQQGKHKGFQRKLKQVHHKLEGFQLLRIESIHGIHLQTLRQHLVDLDKRSPRELATHLFKAPMSTLKEPPSYA